MLHWPQTMSYGEVQVLLPQAGMAGAAAVWVAAPAAGIAGRAIPAAKAVLGHCSSGWSGCAQRLAEKANSRTRRVSRWRRMGRRSPWL